MEIENDKSHDRTDIGVLLALARRLEEEGDYAGAVNAFQLALARLPEDDPRRQQLESTIDYLERTTASAVIIEPRPATHPIMPRLVVGCALVLALILPAAAILSNTSPSSLALPSFRTPVPSLVRRTVAAAPTAQPGPAFFEGGFQSGLDSFKWAQANTAATSIDTSAGTMRLASSSTHFPYVYSRTSPFPATGDFRVTIRYRYPQEGACGAPIAMASFLLPPGLSHQETNQMSSAAEANGVSIWFWKNVLYYRAGQTREDVNLNHTGSAWRQATVEYSGDRYQISLDGSPVYTSGPAAVRPTTLWFGLPFELEAGYNCQWDMLEISEVRVETIP